MAWTAPMTAVSGAIFTANQYNLYVRDNLLEQDVAKVLAASQYCVTSGTNSLDNRNTGNAVVATSETTTSTSYTNLATTGPTISVTTGAIALVCLSANCDNNTLSQASIMSCNVTGASTITSDDSWSICRNGMTGSNSIRIGQAIKFTSLLPGVNTFQASYRVTGGTGTFKDREITVIPF